MAVFNLTKKDLEYFEEFAKKHKLDLADFVKEAVYSTIEDAEDLEAYYKAIEEHEKDLVTYTLQEAKEILGVE